jgi:hypothetical protein
MALRMNLPGAAFSYENVARFGKSRYAQFSLFPGVAARHY